MLKFKTDKQSRDGSCEVLCPLCGFNYVHLQTTEIALGSVRAQAKGDVVKVKEIDRNKHQRGSQIIISMCCENGHQWQIRFWFHEGITSMVIEQPELDNVELWRD